MDGQDGTDQFSLMRLRITPGFLLSSACHSKFLPRGLCRYE